MTIPKKVMIVDDEPDIVGAIEVARESHWYRLGCTDAIKAVQELKK